MEQGARIFPEAELEEGSIGPAVALLQIILKAWFNGRMSRTPVNQAISDGFTATNIKVNGVFDSATRRAVQCFQALNFIEPDGKCGSKTRKIFAQYQGINLDEIPSSIFIGETIKVPPFT